MQMMKGANAPIDGTALTVSWDQTPAGADIDVSAYFLTADRKVEGDDGMAFYGQPTVPGVSLTFTCQQASLAFDLAAIHPAIESIAICAVIDTSKAPSAKLADAGILHMRMGALQFDLDVSGMSEQALILGEVYRRNGVFKLRAVGQGFNGGLAALAGNFGVDVAGGSEPVPAAPQVTASCAPARSQLGQPGAVSAPQPAAPAPIISLKKVTLAKAEKVNLSKGGGKIRARLVWEGRQGGGGDLDFYCFYVLDDGRCGKVYWNDLGTSDTAPFIRHSGDSTRAGEEEIVLERPEKLRFALFAAYSALSNGTGSFKSYRPKMIITDQNGNEVTIPLLNPAETSYWVAITHIAVGNDIQIEHVETYGKSGIHSDAAERAPRLHQNGTWDVSKGEIEFKD
ncbi:TerD family protein [Novosphingobium sp. TCA1]|uniref:TerD family protein n=1 Tax=Novosphingobium sp. TCA1 TaxID=2682474 RepID=UPI00130976F9|nr:TerD family protein [Novosphingobium sp. TCA1]GFE77322.1 hypothetical protein NTCA1_49710 [Novosphingobium sp. TCA1]